MYQIGDSVIIDETGAGGRVVAVGAGEQVTVEYPTADDEIGQVTLLPDDVHMADGRCPKCRHDQAEPELRVCLTCAAENEGAATEAAVDAAADR